MPPIISPSTARAISCSINANGDAIMLSGICDSLVGVVSVSLGTGTPDQVTRHRLLFLRQPLVNPGDRRVVELLLSASAGHVHKLKLSPVHVTLARLGIDRLAEVTGNAH